MFYVYLILLLLILFLIYNGLENTIKYSNIKIKIVSICVFSALLLRCITLLIMFLSESIKYLYYLKPLFFLDLIAIPVGALISLYILSRSDKIKFSYLYIVSGVLTALYIFIVYKLSANLQYVNDFGYILHLNDKDFIYMIYLAVNTVFLSASILFLGSSYSNKPGLNLVLLASIISVIEVIVNLMGSISMPEAILSDLFWLVTINYAISRLRK